MHVGILEAGAEQRATQLDDGVSSPMCARLGLGNDCGDSAVNHGNGMTGQWLAEPGEYGTSGEQHISSRQLDPRFVIEVFDGELTVATDNNDVNAVDIGV